MRRNISGAILALLIACSSRANAEPEIEPAMGDPFQREGFSAGIAVGPHVFVGAPGLSGVVGLGAGFSLRVGTRAGERLQWIAELVSGGFLVSRTDIAGKQQDSYSTSSALSLSAQVYVMSTVWLRFGGGLAAQVVREGGQRGDPIEQRVGLAAVSGAGVDIYRQGILAVDLEAVFVTSAFRGDRVGQAGVMLGINWY